MQRILERLEAAATEAVPPGSLQVPGGPVVRWDAAGLHLEHDDGTRASFGEAAPVVLQVSRSASAVAAPRRFAWSALHTRTVHWFEVQLRGAGLQLGLRGPASADALEGLPWLEGSAPQEIPLEALVELCRAACLHGARTPAGVAQAAAPERPPQGGRPHWRRGSIVAALVVLGAACTAATALLVAFLAGETAGLTGGARLALTLCLGVALAALLWFVIGPVVMTVDPHRRRLYRWRGLFVPLSRGGIALEQLGAASLYARRRHKARLLALDTRDGRTLFVPDGEPILADLSALGHDPRLLPGALEQHTIERRTRREERWRKLVCLIGGLALAWPWPLLFSDAQPPSIPLEGWVVRLDEPSDTSQLRTWWDGRSPWAGARALEDAAAMELTSYGATALEFSRDGTQLLTLTASDLRLWDVATGWPAQTWNERYSHVVALHPDRPLVLTGGPAQQGTEPDDFESALLLGFQMQAACWSEPEQVWLAAGTHEGCPTLARLFPAGRVPESELTQLGDEACVPRSDLLARFSTDCSRLVLTREARDDVTGVELWSMPAAERLWRREVPPAGKLETLALDRDGRTLVMASADQLLLHRFDEAGREVASTSRAMRCDDCLPLALSPDGTTLALAYDREVLRLDLARMPLLTDVAGLVPRVTNAAEPQPLLERGSEDITALRFSPDGRRLAIATADRLVRLVEVSGTGD